MELSDIGLDTDAAVAAACEADAILDSLEMPRLSPSVPSAVDVVSSSSSTSSEHMKGEVSCDESASENQDDLMLDEAGEQHFPSGMLTGVGGP